MSAWIPLAESYPSACIKAKSGGARTLGKPQFGKWFMKNGAWSLPRLLESSGQVFCAACFLEEIRQWLSIHVGAGDNPTSQALSCMCDDLARGFGANVWDEVNQCVDRKRSHLYGFWARAAMVETIYTGVHTGCGTFNVNLLFAETSMQHDWV